MANNRAQKFTSPKVMNVDGRAVWINDKVVNPTLAVNDTFDYYCPAGLEISDLSVQADKMESTTTTTFKLGYTPVDPNSSLAANLSYFAGTGQTLLRAGGRLVCGFKPITFQEDVIIRLTVEVAGTPQAGECFLVMGGNANGPK